MKTDLKETASKSSKPNREIFDEVCRSHDSLVASQIAFPNVVNGMVLRKSERYPRLPTIADQFANLLTSSSDDLKFMSCFAPLSSFRFFVALPFDFLSLLPPHFVGVVRYDMIFVAEFVIVH